LKLIIVIFSWARTEEQRKGKKNNPIKKESLKNLTLSLYQKERLFLLNFPEFSCSLTVKLTVC